MIGKFKNNNSKGFTLIEILVSVSIMIIIGSFGLYSLQNYFVGYSTKKISEKIFNDINYFDDKIRTSQDSSYIMEFYSGTLGYIVNKNFFGKTDIVNINNIDFNTISGVLENPSSISGTWNINIYTDDSLKKSYTYSGILNTTNFSFLGSKNLTYSIKTFFNNSLTNEIDIIYYSKDNLSDEEAKKIKLVSIYSGSDSYDKIEIKNIMGNKEIVGFSGGTSFPINSANFNFEKGGQDFSIEIKK